MDRRTDRQTDKQLEWAGCLRWDGGTCSGWEESGEVPGLGGGRSRCKKAPMTQPTSHTGHDNCHRREAEVSAFWSNPLSCITSTNSPRSPPYVQEPPDVFPSLGSTRPMCQGVTQRGKCKLQMYSPCCHLLHHLCHLLHHLCPSVMSPSLQSGLL